MAKRFLKWSFIAAVLLAAHGYTAWWSARRFSGGGVQSPSGALQLSMSFDRWTSHDPHGDPTVYLNVARNLAAGRGMVERVPNSDPPRYEQFNRWGPGTPAVLGGWLWLFGGQTMWTFFWFAAAAQLMFGMLAVATAALWTRNALALSTVALFTGYCPPLRDFFYGLEMTSAETAALVPLALAFFILAKALLVYRETSVAADRETWRRIGLWFLTAGMMIGLASLCRDCTRVFAVFVVAFLLARGMLTGRRRLALAACAAILLLAGVYVVRYPVQLWNKSRTGRSVVCQTSEGCIFRYGLWYRHDALPWYDTPGIGFGEYLDPTAAERVEAYFQSGKPQPDLYSAGQLLQAIVHRPHDALVFKAARLPVLWLAADRWPDVRWGEAQRWCLGMYGLLAIYCGLQYRRRQPIPEVLYLYLFLVACALPLIHFEFRYTIPVWNTLVIVPGLLVAAWVPSPRSCAENSVKSTTEAASLTTVHRPLRTAP